MTDQTSTKTTEPGLRRDNFPILENKTYLSSHTLGAVPKQTRDSLNTYFDTWNEEGIVAWDGPWWQQVEAFTSEIQTLLNAPENSVVPLQNVTRGMAGAASCFTFEEPKNEIVLTDIEFVTSFAFWNRLKELGAEIKIVESEDGITISPDRMEQAISNKTLLVATCHAFFQSGATQDLKSVVDIAHEHDAHVVGDGYQVTGIVPVDVQDLNIDFYIAGSHKWLCGGAGAGFLYIRPDLLEHLHPRLTGWFGLQNPFGFDVAPDEPGQQHEGAYRFFAGTPNVPGLYAALEGVKIINDIGVDRINRISRKMTQELIQRAESRGFEVKTPTDPERRNGMVCIDFPESEQVKEKLIENDVRLDWRPDCGIRASAHFYNNFEDIDSFWDKLLHFKETIE